MESLIKLKQKLVPLFYKIVPPFWRRFDVKTNKKLKDVSFVINFSFIFLIFYYDIFFYH